MKSFIYNLLSKGLLILLLLALAAGYYYRAELFPQFFANESVQAQAQADAVPATADSPAATAPEPVAVPLPAMPSASSEQAAAPVEQESADTPAEVDAAPVADAAVTQWPEASGAATDAPSATPAASGDGDNKDALQQARNAYWAGDLDGALAAYKQAAAAQPDDPDVQGELGNIYFAQGNWESAATAYLAAGRALLHRGDRAAAEQLLVVLQGLNPEHARSLADELAQQSEGGRQ